MKPFIQDRPQTTASKDVLVSLVYAVKNQLYREEQLQYFDGQVRDLKHALTWPAHWFNDRALFVTEERYNEIVLGVINEIKGHGNTGEIHYWPRYIFTCLQRHFSVNAHVYVNEGKAAVNAVERALKTLKGVPMVPAAAPADARMRELAAVHLATRSHGGRKKKAAANPTPAPAPEPPQKELFSDV